jgi:hypothetical protein
MGLRSLLDPGDWLAIKPQLSPEASPIELLFEPDPSEIRLRLWVGSVVLAIAATAGYFMREDGVALFVAAGFALFAILNLLYAFIQRGFRYHLRISGLEVAVDRRSILGAKNWREPLRAYQGVLLREEEFQEQSSSNSKITHTRRYFIIELQHRDPSRTVPLYVRETGPPPIEIHRAFADRFNLPALEEDLSGPTRADRPQRTADPGPPPPGVSRREAGDSVCLSLASPRRPFGAAFFWLALPLAVGAILYQVDPVFGLAAGGMTAAFVLLILALGWISGRSTRFAPSGLCIGHGRVWIGGPEESPHAAILLNAILQVRLARRRTAHGSAPGFRLIVEGASTRLELGGASGHREALEWIRDYLNHRLWRRN